MDRDFLIRLTQDAYRLTLLFPKKEPLRCKMREVADNIFINPTEDEIEIFCGFCEVAKQQNWVRKEDVLAIQKEYDNLRENLKKAKVQIGGDEDPIGYAALVGIHPQLDLSKSQPVRQAGQQATREVLESPAPLFKTSERQDKILAFLKENGRAQVWQIKEILSDVTKRTLRRDFDYLLSKGFIERVGENNDTAYQLRL